MVTSTQPVYPSTVKRPRAFLRTGTSERIIASDATVTPTLLYVGSNNGAVITQAHIQQLGDNIVTTVRLFSRLGSSERYDLLLEHQTAAITGSTQAQRVPFEEIIMPPLSPQNAIPQNRGIRLEGGEALYATLGLQIATGLNLFLEVQEY